MYFLTLREVGLLYPDFWLPLFNPNDNYKLAIISTCSLGTHGQADYRGTWGAGLGGGSSGYSLRCSPGNGGSEPPVSEIANKERSAKHPLSDADTKSWHEVDLQFSKTDQSTGKV